MAAALRWAGRDVGGVLAWVAISMSRVGRAVPSGVGRGAWQEGGPGVEVAWAEVDGEEGQLGALRAAAVVEERERVPEGLVGLAVDRGGVADQASPVVAGDRGGGEDEASGAVCAGLGDEPREEVGGRGGEEDLPVAEGAGWAGGCVPDRGGECVRCLSSRLGVAAEEAGATALAAVARRSTEMVQPSRAAVSGIAARRAGPQAALTGELRVRVGSRGGVGVGGCRPRRCDRRPQLCRSGPARSGPRACERVGSRASVGVGDRRPRRGDCRPQ